MARILGAGVVSPHPGGGAEVPLRTGLSTQARNYAAAAAESVVIADPMRRMAFYTAIAMIFIRFSVLSELLVAIFNINTYLLYIVGPPAILGCMITGGFGRAFRARPVCYWTGFFVCMLLATPGSSWVGASAGKDIGYLRTDLICMYVIGGLIVTWDEVKVAMNTLALSGIVILIATRLWAKPDLSGRLELELGFDGVISNSNDLSAHLILMLPFVLYFAIKPGRNIVIRLALYASIFYGLWAILGTSSRGAMVGLVGMSLFFLFRASGAQRIAVLVAVPLLAVALVAVLPAANLARLATIFGNQKVAAGADDEAGESTASREYLVQQSIKFTFEHPLFGIGPSQFSNFEGLTAKAMGEHGNWHETHNTYTQISSECGIPALIFALAGLLGTFRLVNKTYKLAKTAGDKEVTQVCFCFLTSLTGYMVTLTFLACAYRFTLPAMIGLGVAIHYAAQRRLASGIAEQRASAAAPKRGPGVRRVSPFGHPLPSA